MNDEPIAVTLRVIRELNALGVAYLIGGSFASALYGEPRATMDADVIADLKPEHAAPLARALKDDFYLDLDTVREAIRTRGSFNAIHLSTSFKVDVFVRRHRAFDDAQFARRVRHTIAVDPERSAFVASAEDSILAKLESFKIGGESSERQWRDVLAILKAQHGALDESYLRRMANALLNRTA